MANSQDPHRPFAGSRQEQRFSRGNPRARNKKLRRGLQYPGVSRTILDAVRLPQIDGTDGRSFLPLLRGKSQSGRNEIYTVFHRTAGRRDYPMRSVLTTKYGYIYNAWSDGKTIFRNESQSGLSFRAMRRAAQSNPKIAARVKLFQYRVPEEFYDYERDPAALHNLIDDPRYRDTIREFRERMRKQMRRLGDPLLPTFRKQVPNRSD